MPAGLLRQLKPDEVVCPAGEQLGDAGCFCRVEQHYIDGHLEPHSIERYCTGCYSECPSWRASKEAIWADGHRQMQRVIASEV